MPFTFQLDLDSVNKILELAKQKNYIDSESNLKCNYFKFDYDNRVFKFFLEKNKVDILNKTEFYECYREIICKTIK